MPDDDDLDPLHPKQLKVCLRVGCGELYSAEATTIVVIEDWTNREQATTTLRNALGVLMGSMPVEQVKAMEEKLGEPDTDMTVDDQGNVVKMPKGFTDFIRAVRELTAEFRKGKK